MSIARYVAEQWPEHDEAQEAVATLVPFLIGAGDLERAQDLLAQLP
jgi:hypothetical protein